MYFVIFYHTEVYKSALAYSCMSYLTFSIALWNHCTYKGGGVAKYLDTLINLHWLIWSNTSYYVHNLGLHGHAYKQTRIA